MRADTRLERLVPTALSPRFAPLRKFWSSTSGAVSAEVVVVIAVVGMLGIGSMEFGRLALEKLSATSAARAGAQYGTLDLATASDTTGIVQAARDDAGDIGGALDVNARQYCFCPSQGEVVCTASCSDGSFSMMYVEVTVGKTYDLLMAYPGVPSPFPVESTVRMRVR